MNKPMNKITLCLLPNNLRQAIGVAATLILVLIVSFGHAGGPRPILNLDKLKPALQEIGGKHKMNLQELESLLQEFEAMRQTDESDVDKFTVLVATPERVDRLYQMPEVALIPKSLRENGLIFAGYPGSRLLKFQKPSDIISKVSFWFPDEIARARSNNRLSPSDIRLWGPFKNWETESAAFMAMWNCVPQIAWLQPAHSPFRNTRSISHPLAPLHARSSDYSEFDFGLCVRTTAGRVVPKLQSKFNNFLKDNRCRGAGPDDCVLVLHLWASLIPDDPELATMMQSLEADVALNSSLPNMKKAYSNWSPQDIDAGAERFDEVWRRAAFLRAKLISILEATDAWPVDALNKTIRQIITLQQLLQTPYAYHFDYVDMDYRSPASSPWLVLKSLRDVETKKLVQAVVVYELSKVERGIDCRVFEPWLTPALRTEIALSASQPSVDRLSECVKPDWRLLLEGESDDAVQLRTRYFDVVQTADPQFREMLLSNLTHDGNDCFGDKKTVASDWQHKLCQKWIHEPTIVTPTLKNTQLRLEKSHQFHKLSSSHPNESEGIDQRVWLLSLAEGMPAEAKIKMSAYANELDRKGLRVDSATLWRHAGHSRALIELGLAGGNCTRLFVLLSPHEAREIDIPKRIWREALCHSEIVRVSDLDQDGNLETWWALDNWGAASFDACKGDDSDLERNLDCSAKNQHAKMAEIGGDALTYFVDNRGARSEVPMGENWTATGNDYPLPAASVAKVSSIEACNRMLIGSVLAAKLGIEAWSENAIGGREVIDIACAKHPVNPDFTLVALFHELSNRDSATDENQVGLVVAVIDIKRRKLLRAYRDMIGEDGGTRIRGSSGSLRLDTARYSLAPNVRAFGVRMNIGYSPRYAEGGSSNYLTLFVEEGKTLRPILSNLAMSSWTMTDSRGCFTNDEIPEFPCLVESEEKHLALSSTSTNGWRDLEVITTRTREGEPKPIKRVREQKLRYQNGEYR